MRRHRSCQKDWPATSNSLPPPHPMGIHKRLSKLIWLAEAAILLAAVLPTLVILNVPDNGRSSAWMLTIAIMAWSGLKLSLIIASGKPRVFEFMFFLFVYIFMGLAPTVQIRSASIASTTKDMPANIDWPTALIVALALGVYELGRLAPARRIDAPTARSQRAINSRALWVLFFIGLAAMLYYVQSVGLDVLLQDRHSRQAARDSSFDDGSLAAIVAAMAWIPLMASSGGFMLVRRRLRQQGEPTGPYGYVALLAAVGVLLVVNPISGARYTSGTVLFALLCSTGILTSRWLRPFLALILAAFLFLFPIADAFRRASVDASRSGFFAEYAGNGDYDAFWQISNSLLFIEQQGITWGNQALGVLLFWIPRNIWPQKPTGTGVLLAQYRGYAFENLSAPLWAEALVNGGVVLMILTFVGLGVLLVRLDGRLPRSLASNSVLALAGMILPAYMIILLRGSLLQATGSLVVMLASLVATTIGGARDSSPPESEIADIAIESSAPLRRHRRARQRTPKERRMRLRKI